MLSQDLDQPRWDRDLSGLANLTMFQLSVGLGRAGIAPLTSGRKRRPHQEQPPPTLCAEAGTFRA